ncbi:conserved hypothetical protein [Leishmania infantum JPCM5]|uniref:PB1 domain-containing protein n=1 Tax=Leishmania infantum TaxID=5671 RepID=A4HYK5_LEIIN|nr:conserved hypothetical protein [Leishmania infantum JPCM5]CAM67393.2 conserved hypothetical protein [Leishmania infantum JPCM5]|eukprot:XP_001465146.2 conserved hypothetical protein [Leishmania infantum JPCM5]
MLLSRCFCCSLLLSRHLPLSLLTAIDVDASLRVCFLPSPSRTVSLSSRLRLFASALGIRARVRRLHTLAGLNVSPITIPRKTRHIYPLPWTGKRGDNEPLPSSLLLWYRALRTQRVAESIKAERAPKGLICALPVSVSASLTLFLSLSLAARSAAKKRLSIFPGRMKCVLVVHSGDERMQRSCDLPDGVSTQEQLRAFVRSQDLRLDSLDFTFAVSLVRLTAGAAEKTGEKVVLRKDADVQQLLKTAKQQRATHVLTFEVTISGSSSSPRSLGSFLSSEYAVDKDLVTLHVFAPLASPSRGNNPSYQEKMFIIPTRFVLESLARAVEDTLSIKLTNSGMKLVLYTMPQQPNDNQVEIIDDTAALQLLRQHASQRTPVRLTYATHARTPKTSSGQMSRRASQQQFTAPHPPSPPPAHRTEVSSKPKPHLPSLSNLASEPSSQPSREPPSQALPERKSAVSPPSPSRKAATPSSSAPPTSPPPGCGGGPPPHPSPPTPRIAYSCARPPFLRPSTRCEFRCVQSQPRVLPPLLPFARCVMRNRTLSSRSASPMLSPDTAAPAASSPLPLHNGGTSDSSQAAQIRVPSSQHHSNTPLQDIAASSAPPKESPTKVGAAPPSTRHPPLSPNAASSSAGAERAKDATAKAPEEDTAEADAPPLVIRTAAGTSTTSVTAECLPCVCEPDSGDASSVRFQVLARWGAEQQMMLFRLREGTALDDLRRAVLDAFCSGVAGTDDEPPLTMEVRYVAAGQLLRVLLVDEAQLLDLRGALLVDSAEIHVTAPTTPPPPRRVEEASGNTSGTAQVAAAVLQLLADAVVQHLGSRPSVSSVEISDLVRSQLGKQAATDPFRGFLDGAVATPFDAPTPDPDGAASWGAHVLPWLSSVLDGMQAPPPAATEVAVEVASSLLRSLLCDGDFLLDQLAASVRAVGDNDEGSGTAAPGTTVWPSLAALWTDAGLATPTSSSRAEWHPFRAAYVGGASGWKTAYAAAPAAMLDLIAAGVMDGVWAFPRRRHAQADMVWQRSLAKAHRDCCESINPTELERYFKSGDCPNRDGALDHRRVILSCVGALLAPPSASVVDYAEWLTQHFRGKVATVLYTNMVDYDGRSSLSVFHVTQMSWILLHPQLRRIGEAASSLTTLQRLRAWALLATARACQRLHVPFPPCPLLHIHKASPVPFTGPALPAVVAADTAAADVATATPKPGAFFRPPCDVAAADAPAAALLRPSPPSAGVPPLTAHQAAPRKVQYACKYNFDALHRPVHRGSGDAR